MRVCDILQRAIEQARKGHGLNLAGKLACFTHYNLGWDDWPASDFESPVSCQTLAAGEEIVFVSISAPSANVVIMITGSGRTSTSRKNSGSILGTVLDQHDSFRRESTNQ